MKKNLKLDIPELDKVELTKRANSHTLPSRDVFRAKIILCRGEGMSKSKTANIVRTSEVTVQKWTDRYRSGGMSALCDRKGRGRKPTIDNQKREAIITKPLQPPKGKTRHSTRSIAKEVGVSQSTVQRIWKANGIKPHLIRQFKISKDPLFLLKFWDVINLYLNPPSGAVVLCCDEKTQCQALERTQPGLPLGIGHICTQTHDYIRHGTTTLFAALDYSTGKIIYFCRKKHTHEDWLAFLKLIRKNMPKDKEIHIIADNYATHKHKKVQNWLRRNRSIKIHFTPTSSSWMNLVERFFGEITRDCIRDQSFTSVKELESAIKEFIELRNENPKRFVWKKEGEEILRKINSARKVLNMELLNEEKPKAQPAKKVTKKRPKKGKVIRESAH